MEEKQNNLYTFDLEYRTEKLILCGVDEAGRGPLAGDVYAAAVILDEKNIIEGINDSKKISEKKRDALYEEIIEKSISYSIATASVEEIDNYNILNAAMLAMKRAIEGLDLTPTLVLIDGNKKPELSVNSISIIKGDTLSASIAAASILAKVARDNYMKEVAKKYPQYLFEKHKGYATKLHYEMLDTYGQSDVHRNSFLRKYYNDKQGNG
jgi:ribonuclease HII